MQAKKSVLICCSIITVLGLTACGSSTEEAIREEAVRPVKLVAIAEASTDSISRFPAVVAANTLYELGFQVGGLVKNLQVKESEKVAKGQVVAQLDQRDFKSALNSAKAQFDNAKQEFERAERLAAKDAIAKSVVEQRKAQLDVAQSGLDQAQKALADTVLIAPADGIVVQTLAKQLQTVSPGTTVVKIMDESRYKATIDIPANFIAKLPKDESDTSNREAFVLFDVAPNQRFTVEFKEITLLADEASQTYAATFTFEAPESFNVLPGMNATIELRRTNTNKAARVAVPVGAISTDGESTFVWIIEQENMTVSKRAVTVEDSIGEVVVVTSGLQPRDVIAGAGAAYLSEGMKVRAWK